ncbi:MAG: VOC family protein [Actinomycetota bacterium]
MSDWPSLSSPGPLVLVTFLTSAPDFTERAVHTGDGGAIVHAELVRTGATGAPAAVLLGPAHDGCRPPGGAAVHLVCDDPAPLFARAVAAGATVVHAPFDADDGSRLFAVADPDGNHWSGGTWYE